ncbi:MAG: zinc-finger domain-containing protein [Rhodospirillaceae bacterium]
MTDTASTPRDTAHQHHAVSCDGGGGALGHPKVYLEFNDGRAVCPYCGKVFTANPKAGAAA